jgi:hypothetical protein
MIDSVNVKKTVTIVASAFAVFFVFSAPADAATMVKETANLAWNLLTNAAHAMQLFVTTLIR